MQTSGAARAIRDDGPQLIDRLHGRNCKDREREIMKREREGPPEISRRQFCGSVAAALAVPAMGSALWSESPAHAAPQGAGKLDLAALDRARILKAAQQY